MAKRFTDTDKYKKDFIRGLQGAYKVLWDYILGDCDHAGIWHVNFDIAQLFVGTDLPINQAEALTVFAEKIEVFDNGKKWFIPSFIEFQYGTLDDSKKNRAHSSVIDRLRKYGFWSEQDRAICLRTASIKPLLTPLEGCKDKEKDKDKEKESFLKERFGKFWAAYPKRKAKAQALKSWLKISPDEQLTETILQAVKRATTSEEWKKDKGQFIPFPASYLNGRRWEDETEVQVVERPDKYAHLYE